VPGSRVVVVTGASAGVGRAVSIAFGRRGDAVALVARGAAGLKAAVADVEAAGGRALAIEADVADAAAVAAAADRAEHELGPIDVWVNNAMATVFAPVSDITPGEFARVTEVTYLGQVHGTMAALERMRSRDHGTIVNVGSALAYRSIPLQSAYCGAKFAVRGFTDAVRTELIADRSNVRIVSVHLPAVNTPQFGWCRSRLRKHPQPVAPIYPPEVAADAIVAAADGIARERVLGSWNRMLVAANKVMPFVLDHYAARTAVAGQQSDIEVPVQRPDDLDAPLDGDDGHDHGAHGIFGDQDGGVRDPAFIRSLPKVGVDLTRSVVDAVRSALAVHTGGR
jgi:NAD(P)-dependent dehydrogenase (short-subunit alcohol dehydrogenase family)